MGVPKTMKLTFHTACLALASLTMTWSAWGMNEPGTDLNLWPILMVDRDESGSDVRFLLPLGQFTNKDEEVVKAIRPLFIWHRKPDGERSLDLPWPVFQTSIDAEGRHSWHVLPVFYESRDRGDRYLIVFPVAWSWWNTVKTPGESKGTIVGTGWYYGHYGPVTNWSQGVWPLYWFWHNRHGRGFWFMPIHWRADEGEKSGREFDVAPVFWAWWDAERKEGEPKGVAVGSAWYSRDYGEDPDWNGGLLPLFGQWRKGERKGLLVAPFYWGRENGRTSSLVLFPLLWKTAETAVLFPLYWSFDDPGVTVVFPLYGRMKDKWTFACWPAYLQTKAGDHRIHHVAWPILSWGRDEDGNRRFSLWPLLGEQSSSHEWSGGAARNRTRWALWPLIWATEGESCLAPKDEEPEASLEFHETAGELEALCARPPQDVAERRCRWSKNVFPLYWSGGSTRWLVSEGETGAKHHNWLLPLYTYNSSEDEKVLTVLWPLWRDADGEDRDRYSVLWRLFDARFYPNGDRNVSVLWRGYRNERKGEIHKVDVFPFISHRRTAPGEKRTQFLGGFFGFGKESDRSYVRVLYLPKLRFGGKTTQETE